MTNMFRSAGARQSAQGVPGSIADRFRLTMLPHLDAAYTFARYLTRDTAAADDIVQDSYLRAYRAFATYRGDSDRAWLFAILRNCWRDWVRHNANRSNVLDDPQMAEPDPATPETILLREGTISGVRAAIEALPIIFREAIVLRELEELSYREIAEILDVPIGTVMSRLARGRQLLVALIGPGASQAEPLP